MAPPAESDRDSVPPEDASVPWRSATVQVVLLSTMLAPLGVPLLAPALPVIRDAFGVTDPRASLVVSVYFLTGIALSPVLGLLADRVGRRRVLVPSLFLFSLAGVAVLFAPTFDWVLAARLVQGTAAAGIFVVTVTLIGDVFEAAQRNAVLGVNAAALFGAAAAYPLLGGALAAVGWYVPFLVYAVGLPVGLFAYHALEEPVVERETRGAAYFRGALAAMPTDRALVLYGATLAMETLTFGAILTSLPFLLVGSFDLGPVTVGLLLTATTVVSAVVAFQNGRLVRHVSNDRLLAASFGCFGVGLFGTWLAPTVVTVAAALLVYGVGLGVALPSIDSAVSGLVQARYRAGALSLRNSMSFLGRSAGPVLFTGAAVVTGYRALLLAGGLAALALCGVVLLAAGRGGEGATSARRVA